MSKYLAFSDVVFKDRPIFLAALADLGVTAAEEGEALPLYGYLGDRRTETAECPNDDDESCHGVCF